MKKIMLIAIAVVSLLFVSNAFGQAADWEIKPMVKKPKTTIKKRITKPTGIMQDYYAHSNIRSKTARKSSKNEVSIETIERSKKTRKRRN